MERSARNIRDTHAVMVRWQRDKLGDRKTYYRVLNEALYGENATMRDRCWLLIVMASGVSPYTVAQARNCTEREVIEIIDWFQRGGVCGTIHNAIFDRDGRIPS